MDFGGQVLGNAGYQGHFAVLGRTQSDYAGAQLLPEAVDELSKSRAVNILHLFGNNLNAFNELHAGSQVFNLSEGPFAFPGFELFFELLHGVRPFR